MLALAVLDVAGCSGDDGKSGGPGPTGPTGPGGGIGPTGPTSPPSIIAGGPVNIGNGSALTAEQIEAIGYIVATLDSASIPADAPVPVIEFALKVNIWVLAENYYDLLKPDSKITKRYRSVPGKSIHAEWGSGYYVETVVNGQANACMFDFGLDPAGVMNNMGVLGIDIGKARAFCLSHGHWDHYGTAVSILKQNQSRIASGTPFYVGERHLNVDMHFVPDVPNPMT